MNEFIGASVAMHCVRVAVQRFAASEAPLVLIGETGTGKSRLARLVTASGPRATAPFVCIDGAALDHGLVPVDVQYAWAAAEGGTLFVDHIGETPPDLQVHLAKLLAQRHTHAAPPRLIAANQRRLEGAVATGAFDASLFAYLHHAAIHLPALRHRPEDIPGLAEHYLKQLSPEQGFYKLNAAAVVRLQAHGWPGNVRELHNVLSRAMVLAGSRLLLNQRDIVFDARGFAVQSATDFQRLRAY